MASRYTINFTREAQSHLEWFDAYDQRIILSGLEVHLQHQPTTASRRLKPMRPNPVAGWELRLGDYRVLFDVDEARRTVSIQAIGMKIGNRLIVRGKELRDHESNQP